MVNTKALLIIGGIILLVVALNPGILKKIIGEDAKYITCETKLVNPLGSRVRLDDFQCTYINKKCVIRGNMQPADPIANNENKVSIFVIADDSVTKKDSVIEESYIIPKYKFEKLSMCVKKESTTAKVEIRDKDGIVGESQDSII